MTFRTKPKKKKSQALWVMIIGKEIEQGPEFHFLRIKSNQNGLYRKFSNITRTKSQNLNASRLIL